MVRVVAVYRLADRLHWQEDCRGFRLENAPPHLAPPVPQQPTADVLSSSDLVDPWTARLLHLRDDPKLFRQAPAPPPFNSGDNLHAAACL